MSDTKLLLQAAAINALYSGNQSLCSCGLGATLYTDAGDVLCDTCEGSAPSGIKREFRHAEVTRKLNALSGLR